MSNTQTIPYYLYTNGKLKKVERQEPTKEEWKESKYPVDNFLHEKRMFDQYINSLPSIEVHEDLKKVWKEGERYYEGKDFQLRCQQSKCTCGNPFNGSSDCLIAIPIPVEAENTYSLTAIQMQEIYSAGAKECFDFAGLPSEFPDYVKENVATYLKEHFGIELTDLKE